MPVNGRSYVFGGLTYIGQTGATAIADLPGLVPGGQVTPTHFGARTDILTDYSAQVQAAMNWCGANGRELVFDVMYRVDGVAQVSNLTCRGPGGLVSYQVKSWTGAGPTGQQ